MKESKSIPDKTVLFHEPFLDWSEVADNGGVRNGTPTIANGICTFNGTTDYITYPKAIGWKGIKSVVFLINLTNTTGDIIDFDGGTHSIEVTAGTLTATGFVAPTFYVNAVATATITTGWKLVIITTATGFNATSAFKIGKETAYLNGSIDKVIVFNRQLTVDEVSALFCNNLYILPTSAIEVLSINNILGTITDRWGNVITNTAVTIPRRGDIYTMGFNGTTSKLVANTVTTTGMLGTTTGTIAAWINLNTIATTPQIIDFGDTDADTRIQFDVFNTGYLRSLVAITGTTYWALDTDNAVIGTSKWIHVGLVQDGTSPVLYINGVAIAQAFSTSTDKTKWFSTMSGLDNFRIGCGNWNSGGDTNYLKGLISQPIVVKDAYSSLQMTRLYNSQKRLYGL